MNYEYDDLLDQPIDDENTSEPEQDSESDLYEDDILNMYLDDEPKFRVGDVVNSTDDPERTYTVAEVVTIDDGILLKYKYEVVPIYEDILESTIEPETYICEEAELIFQYHDATWEEYFTEGARQTNVSLNGEALVYITP